jgi:hypothetical protein
MWVIVCWGPIFILNWVCFNTTWKCPCGVVYIVVVSSRYAYMYVTEQIGVCGSRDRILSGYRLVAFNIYIGSIYCSENTSKIYIYIHIYNMIAAQGISERRDDQPVCFRLKRQHEVLAFFTTKLTYSTNFGSESVSSAWIFFGPFFAWLDFCCFAFVASFLFFRCDQLNRLDADEAWPGQSNQQLFKIHQRLSRRRPTLTISKMMHVYSILLPL